MQFSILPVFLAALIAAAVASPVALPNADALEARRLSFDTGRGGSATSGNSGNVNGGSVLNNAGGQGTVVNEGASCEHISSTSPSSRRC